MASVPSPRTWVDGVLASSGDLNADVRDSYEFLLKPPMAIAQFNRSQSAPWSAIPLEFDNFALDRDGGFSGPGSGRTHYLCRSAGWYHMTLRLTWVQEGFGGPNGAYVGNQVFNSSSGASRGLLMHTTHPSQSTTKSYSNAGVIYLAVGDRCSAVISTVFTGFSVASGDWGIRWISK